MCATDLTRRPRILYLDAYDPFANNIIAQIEQCLDVDVVKCYVDSDPETWPTTTKSKTRSAKFLEYLGTFDAVIAGSGPGSPTTADDSSWIRALWYLKEADTIPVLAISLGFQSLCATFGADIEPLASPRHGLASVILHNSSSIFTGVQQLRAIQYHSLQVMLGHRIQTQRAVKYPAELWEATEQCPELVPLAWDFENKENGAVLKAVRHTAKPFWGVQFHTASVQTNEEGRRIISNWWDEARAWYRRRDAKVTKMPQGLLKARKEKVPEIEHATIKELCMRLVHGDEASAEAQTILDVQCATTGSGRLTVSDVVELFDGPQGEAIVLESGLQKDLRPLAAETGRHSIIGLVVPKETMRLHYYAESHTMQLRDGNDTVVQEWHTDDPWQYIKGVMASLRAMLGQKPKNPTWAPFWGGLIGYTSPLENKFSSPDICLAYITRSIVIDHQLKKTYVQSIRASNDSDWVSTSLDKIYDAVGRKSLESSPNPTPRPRSTMLNPFEHHNSDLSAYLSSTCASDPDRARFLTAAAQGQARIAEGHGPSAHVTSEAIVSARRPRACRLSKQKDNELSWQMYRRLASRTAAPFAAYLRLHNTHLLSASPERLLSWDRAQVAECRVVSGRISKSAGLRRADAEAWFEEQETSANSAIGVDAARSRLHGVFGSKEGTVSVRETLIEEYETDFQKVSVLEGTPCLDDHVGDQGFAALIASVPTSAAGVLGYLDIGGGGDFSLLARAAVKLSPGQASAQDEWHVPAHTSITALNTPFTVFASVSAELSTVTDAFAPETPHVRAADDDAASGSKGGAWHHLSGLEDFEGQMDGELAAALERLRAFREELSRGEGDAWEEMWTTEEEEEER